MHRSDELSPDINCVCFSCCSRFASTSTVTALQSVHYRACLTAASTQCLVFCGWYVWLSLFLQFWYVCVQVQLHSLVLSLILQGSCQKPVVHAARGSFKYCHPTCRAVSVCRYRSCVWFNSCTCLASLCLGISMVTGWQGCQRVFWVLPPNFISCKFATNGLQTYPKVSTIVFITMYIACLLYPCSV